MRKLTTILAALVAICAIGCGGNGLGPSMVSGNLQCIPGQTNTAVIGGQNLSAITSAIGQVASIAAASMAMAQAQNPAMKDRPNIVGVRALQPSGSPSPVGNVNFSVSTLGGPTQVSCDNSVSPQITVSPGQ